MLIIKTIFGCLPVGTPLMFEEGVSGDLYSFTCHPPHTRVHAHTHTHTPSAGIFAYRLLRADYSPNQNRHNQ